MLTTFEETWNGSKRIKSAFRFFRIITAPAAVDVRVGRGGVASDEFLGAPAGVWHRAEPGTPDYDVIEIENNGSQTVKWILCDGETGYDRITLEGGEVTIDELPQPDGLPYTQDGVSTGAASSVLLAANAARKYLLIQNRDASADLHVTCDGSAATVDHEALLLAPGETWEPRVPPTGEIRVISSSAANIAVHVIEA